MADQVTPSHSGAGPKRVKQMAKKSNTQQHKSTTAEHDMGAFQELPPLTNIGSFPMTTAPTQITVFRPPLHPRHGTLTLQDESDNGKSDPESESETQPPSQPQTQTQPQPQTQHIPVVRPRLQTYENGSGSSLDDQRITITPCGDGFYPVKKPIEDIGNAIMGRFGEGESNWKKVNPDQRKLWFEDFKKKYKWSKTDDLMICKNFEMKGSSRYRSIMQEVRKSKQQPIWMGDAAYAKLSDYWRSPDFAKKSDLAKRNRNEDAGACMHTTGSKPHYVVWLEMKEKNGGVDPPLDEFFSCTHKLQKGPNVGIWVNQQSQTRFESFSRLKQQIVSSHAHQSEDASQDEATQATMPSDLCIYSQSVGGKKKGRIAGLGSLARALDTSFSLQATQLPCPLFDNPIIASMKNDMEVLRRENEQLKQHQEIANKTNEQLKQQQEIMSKQLQQILQQLPHLNNNFSDTFTFSDP